MSNVIQEYGAEHNLAFTTSKTKCIIFSGNKRVQEPPPIMLNGKALPFVRKVDHLGHVLHQSMSMENDSIRAKNSFKRRANDIRDQLHFCSPQQKMTAINLYCTDAYGVLLYDLQSEYASSLYKQWSIQARLAHGVKMETHTNVVEGFLCSDMVSLKTQVLSRYPKFVRKLLGSSSKEIRFLSRILITDQRSNLCRNITYVSDLTKLQNVVMVASWRVKQALKVKCTLEPWRKALLTSYMQIRFDKSYSEYNMSKEQCDKFIDSLCIS